MLDLQELNLRPTEHVYFVRNGMNQKIVSIIEVVQKEKKG